jgi:hypothetical protein
VNRRETVAISVISWGLSVGFAALSAAAAGLGSRDTPTATVLIFVALFQGATSALCFVGLFLSARVSLWMSIALVAYTGLMYLLAPSLSDRDAQGGMVYVFIPLTTPIVLAGAWLVGHRRRVGVVR